MRSRPGETVFTVKIPITQGGESGKIVVMSTANAPSDGELKTILKTVKTIAVVGLSSKEDRPAHQVPAFLQKHGYRIIPVNPTLVAGAGAGGTGGAGGGDGAATGEALGEKAYAELRAVPEAVDAVLVFVRSEAVPPVVDQAIEIGARVVWMQEGIINNEAAEHARAAGLKVVMDRCMRSTWGRLMR